MGWHYRAAGQSREVPGPGATLTLPLLAILSVLALFLLAASTASAQNSTQNIAQDMPQSAASPAYSLSSLPSKCVSLKRGLVCYQALTLSWRADELGDYCIVQQATALPQKCWLQQQSGEVSFEFASETSRRYALRHRGSNTDLASVLIEVKWVYKQHRKDTFKWRLF